MSGRGPVGIVGGGLAGSLLALELVERGLAVTLIDAGQASATALSYGGVAWWAGPPGPLGRLQRRAPACWRRLQRRHGPLGWHGCGLRLHGGWGSALLRLPFAQVDTTVLLAALPRLLEAAGVRLRQARVVAPPEAQAGGWRLPLEPPGDLVAEQVVLAAGAGCRALWPGLSPRHRCSWAGVLALPGRPAPPSGPAGRWLRAAAAGRIVQPRHWQRPRLEAEAPVLQEERWIVDAGCAPWGDGLLLGQITLVAPGADCPPPPPPAAMERRLRGALQAFDPGLAALPGRYRQVPVAFAVGGLPLVGPLPGVRGLWMFSGFSGAFAQVPVLAPLLADAIAGGTEDARLAHLGTAVG